MKNASLIAYRETKMTSLINSLAWRWEDKYSLVVIIFRKHIAIICNYEEGTHIYTEPAAGPFAMKFPLYFSIKVGFWHMIFLCSFSIILASSLLTDWPGSIDLLACIMKWSNWNLSNSSHARINNTACAWTRPKIDYK
jgi:hypothetical protein